MRVFIFFLAYGFAFQGSTTSWAYDSDKLLLLARASIVAGVHRTAPPKFEASESAKPVFITIEREGKVIGCRGSLRPRTQSIEAEVVASARSAATTDPRYRPLTPQDLKNFRVTVTVVESQSPISAAQIASLEREDGLVLKAGNRTGIVLPWEGSDPSIRLKWAYKKAGVAQGAACQLFRLKAERFAD
jgi:AMMECR1 domain-containing protein